MLILSSIRAMYDVKDDLDDDLRSWFDVGETIALLSFSLSVCVCVCVCVCLSVYMLSVCSLSASLGLSVSHQLLHSFSQHIFISSLFLPASRLLVSLSPLI